MEPEDDSLAKPGEEAASSEEVCEAIRNISEPGQRRLDKAAHSFLRLYPQLARNIEAKELLDMAVMASLEPDGRKWPKHRIDIVRFLAEAMRSIAFNEARKLKSGTQPDLVSETDLQNPDNDRAAGSVLESLAAPTPGSDDVLLERERQAKRQAKVALLRAQLAAENREISRIFELGLENLSKADIRQRLGMTDTAFWTADRRLTRRIEQLMEHWDEDDS